MRATILSDTHYLVEPGSIVEKMAVEAALYIQHPQLRMLQKRNSRLANWDGLVKFCKPYGSGFAVADGLLPRLRTFAEGNNMLFECDQRPMAEPVPFQQLLIDAELDAQQVAAAKAIMERRIACLEFKTGSGKSEIFLNAILCLQAAGQSTCALIIVPRKNLMYQTAERAELRTGQRIGLIGDGHCDVHPINVAVADSASGSERLANSEEIRATLRRVDCLILDECVPGDCQLQTDAGLISMREVMLGAAHTVLSQNVAGGVEMQPIISRQAMGFKELLSVQIETGEGLFELLITDAGRVWTTDGYTVAADLQLSQTVSVLSCSYLHEQRIALVHPMVPVRTSSGADGAGHQFRQSMQCGVSRASTCDHSDATGAADTWDAVGRRVCKDFAQSTNTASNKRSSVNTALNQEAGGILPLEVASASHHLPSASKEAFDAHGVWQGDCTVHNDSAPVHSGAGTAALYANEDGDARVPQPAGRFWAGGVVDGRRINGHAEHAQLHILGAGDCSAIPAGTMERGDGHQAAQRSADVVHPLSASEANSRDCDATRDSEPAVQVRRVSGCEWSAHGATIAGRVVAVRRTGRFVETYDIGVANNANFFADGVLVHNCHHSQSERWTGIIAACTTKQRLWAVSGKVTFFSKDHILDQMRLEEVFGPPVLTGRSDLRTCPVHVICHHYHQWDGEYDQYELAGSVTDMLPVLYKENGEWVHGIYRGLDDDGKAPDFMLKWNKNTERWVVDRDMYGVYADVDSTDRIELESADIVYYTRHDMAIVANMRRNRWAVRVATAAARKHHPFIITVKRRKHLERMLRLCREAKLNIGSVEQLDDFKAGKLSGLVATASTVSEGTDIPQLIHLIKADGDSGEQVLEQQAGRVMRVFPGKEMGIIHCPRDSMHAALNRVTGSTLNYWRRSGHKITTKHYDDENAPLMLTP